MQYSAYRSCSRQLLLLGCVLATLLALAGCGPATASGSSTAIPDTATWRTYTDSAYHLKTLIPPGWRVGTMLDTIGQPQPCKYDVIFFPPGDTHQATETDVLRLQRFMAIYVNLKCPPPDDTPNKHPNNGVTVTVSGVAAKMYTEDSSSGVLRLTFAHFGDQIIGFYVTGTPQDGALYMGVLSGFEYLGGK